MPEVSAGSCCLRRETSCGQIPPAPGTGTHDAPLCAWAAKTPEPRGPAQTQQHHLHPFFSSRGAEPGPAASAPQPPPQPFQCWGWSPSSPAAGISTPEPTAAPHQEGKGLAVAPQCFWEASRLLTVAGLANTPVPPTNKLARHMCCEEGDRWLRAWAGGGSSLL